MNRISRRTALKRVGTGAALAVSAALLTGCNVPAAVRAVTPAFGVTATGVVAAWHMDEASGSVMHDYAAASHNGSLHSVQLGQPGSVGTAYGFNGSSSYVSIPSSSSLNPGAKGIVATIRLKTTFTPRKPDWDLFRKGKVDTTGGEWKMEYQPSGQASCGFKGSKKSSSLMAGPALNNGQWHTVQCVKTAASIQLIVDGRVFSKSTAVGSISNSAPIIIGAHPGGEFFKGALDEASIQIS